MDFSIHMGIPEMLELWMRLHKESMDGSISKADANLYKKWGKALVYHNSMMVLNFGCCLCWNGSPPAQETDSRRYWQPAVRYEALFSDLAQSLLQ